MGWQVRIMVQKQVQFHSPFGPPIFGPWEKRQTQRNGGAVQRQQLVLEFEPVLAVTGQFADLKGLVKKLLIHLPGPMGVGIRQSVYWVLS